jgi:uncharacterized protein YcbX
MNDDRKVGAALGTVAECRRYPVKSMQGLIVDRLEIDPTDVLGDRVWGIISEDGSLLSAKQRADLLMASADDEGIDLPDGTRFAFGDDAMDVALSTWLGAPVRLARPSPDQPVHYRMTFDPPNDDAELVDIPVPAGTFLDAAPVHLVTTATLAGAAAEYPELDWDVRRFRPNLVVDVDGASFVEETWVGRPLAVGPEVVLQVDHPTVRCAMPLRAQPGLERENGLYAAMTALNETWPNHFGVYGSVMSTGVITAGDEVRLLD